MEKEIKRIVSDIIAFLAEKQYQKIVTLTQSVRLNKECIQKAIETYGRTIINPPDSAFDFMSIIEVRNSNPQQWSVVMPLWTKEEGRSDLSIELTLIKEKNNYKVEVDDIHVL